VSKSFKPMPETTFVPEAGRRCIACDGPASPPARMGWFKTPEAPFVVCGRCADCDDAELERKIAALVTVPAALAAE
jgi:hypothetical protein